jgi:putative ABC transport system substrate-binding protein
MGAEFRRGLKEAGFVEGQNVQVDYLWADNDYDRLPSLAAELVRRRVAVIFAFGSTPATLAAKAATATIPIVFTAGGDPIDTGIVGSLNRPNGNVTGVAFLTSKLVAKQFEMISRMVPLALMIGVLINPANPNSEAYGREAQLAALGTNRKVVVVNAKNDLQLDAAFETLVRQGAGALVIPGDVLFYTRREKIVSLAARHAIPAIYAQREFVDEGGLMNYGASVMAASRIAAGYIGRILNGEKPADLPVQQSTTVEFVINRKTAKAFGLTFPLDLLGRADEVIE